MAGYNNKAVQPFSLVLVLAASVLACCGVAHASSDPFTGLLAPGEAGIGGALQLHPPLYRGSDRRSDLMVLFMYDSPYFYLQSNRMGLKLESAGWRNELFLQRRFEGFASDDAPTSMQGMEKRAVGADIGLSTQVRLGEGSAYADLLTDATHTSEGSELRLGYRYERWWRGQFRLRPYVTFAFRDAKLNNYYYGVRPSEATAERPAYEPGEGVSVELGLQAAYRLAEHWQLFGGVGLLVPSRGIRNSPVVEDRLVPSASVGLMYGFAPQPAPFGERRPLIVKVLHGASTDCNFLPIVTLQCTSTHTKDPTGITALDVGRKLVEGVNGWPLDLAGFVGLLHHEEKDLQPDSWQVNAYYKLYYYGFPWNAKVRTRLAFGAGLSYAGRVPFSEQQSQAERGRDTSKLLLYLDPTVDVSVGDIFGARSLRDTYAGLGVSHRSGIFGSSQLFNNVNGGSNYIYAYVEWTM